MKHPAQQKDLYIVYDYNIKYGYDIFAENLTLEQAQTLVQELWQDGYETADYCQKRHFQG